MRSVLVVLILVAGCTKEPAPAAVPPPSVKVQLPRARSGGEIGNVARVTVGLDGQAFVNGLAVASDEELSAKLRELRTQTPGVEVHVVSDPGVTYARIITVLDGHPLALSWLGSVRGQRVVPLGIEGFGQSRDVPDLYRTYKLNAAAIIDAVARAIS